MPVKQPGAIFASKVEASCRTPKAKYKMNCPTMFSVSALGKKEGREDMGNVIYITRREREKF